MKGRVLVVDDDLALCDVLSARLGKRGYEMTTLHRGEEALKIVRERSFDVVLADVNMPGLSGIELAERVSANRPDVPTIVITAFGSLDTAVAAIRAGAYDFITKPFEIEAVDLALERAIQHRVLREELRTLRSAVGAFGDDGLVGSSSPMRRLRSLLARIAASDASVLIYGETGTGKELVARAVHRRSDRSREPFVAVNCAAMPATLLEAELFGHLKGAFTDAKGSRAGLCAEAGSGTLFFDEIGELPLEMQPKLLRVLQERCFRPVGSDREVAFEARIVAATNRDLQSDVEEGRFREDLFYRLDVLSAEVPPLRARGTDILELAQCFIARAAETAKRGVVSLSTPAAERLMSYTWPGNVRELENCVERGVALANFDKLVVEDLPERIRNYQARDVLVASDNPSELVTLEEVERRYARRVLEAAGGNKARAARILGVDRKTLYRKLGADEGWGKSRA